MTPPAAAAAPAVHPRPDVAPGRRRSAPPRPRRVSGPARPARTSGPSRALRTSRTGGGIALSALSALERLANHRLLDRLIRGRISIGLVAFALIGIVTLQLGLLTLNTSIGRTLEHESQLQRQNAALSVENAELTEANRVEASAAQLGMEPATLGSLRFLSARPRIDPIRGASALKASIQASGDEGAAARAATGEPAEDAATRPSEGASAESASQATGESGGAPRRTDGEATSGAPAASAPSGAAAEGGGSGAGSSEAAPEGGASKAPSGAGPSAGTAGGAGGQAAPTG
jgi:cell division protein FtsL